MFSSTRSAERQVVLTFDDAVASQALFVAPLLLEYNFKATFYITEYKGPGGDLFASDKHQYMTWEQIAELHRLGFEIGNHTLTHPNLPTLSHQELIAEISGIEQRCAAQGIPQPVTFCYPAGVEDPRVIPILQNRGYHLARAVGDRYYSPQEVSGWSVPSFVIKDEKEPQFYEIIDALPAGQIAVLTFHGVPDQNHPWVNTSPQSFLRMMRHLALSGVRVVSMRDLIAR